jgi:hypothetical protein
MKHRNSHFAVGYWSRIKQGRPTPDQCDIDPKALKRLLPFVFLLDFRSEGTATYRLAGTTLCERYGGELRGRDYLGFWDPDSRKRLHELLRQALAAKLPLCLTSVGSTEDCRMIEIETVLMPITFGADIPERFLGVAQVLTDVAALSGRTISFERLTGAELVEEGTLERREFPLPLAGERRGGLTRAPHLRLVTAPRNPGGDMQRFDANERLRRLFAHYGESAQPAHSKVETPVD